MDVIDSLVGDLNAETDELISVIGPLTRKQWDTLTPAPGWTIGDQVTHLLVTESRACLAAADTSAFAHMRSADLADPGRLDRAVTGRRATPPRRGNHRAPRSTREAGQAATDSSTACPHPLVRARYGCGEHVDRAAHGDMGTRPGHS